MAVLVTAQSITQHGFCVMAADEQNSSFEILINFCSNPGLTEFYFRPTAKP